jgi:hypothetical protein
MRAGRAALEAWASAGCTRACAQLVGRLIDQMSSWHPFLILFVSASLLFYFTHFIIFFNYNMVGVWKRDGCGSLRSSSLFLLSLGLSHLRGSC